MIEKQKNTVCFLLGSNKGGRDFFLSLAAYVLNKNIGPIIQESPIYESKPWGFQAKTKFLNQVIICQTHLSATNALKRALDIESQLGRKRSADPLKYKSRTIDIDILFYNSKCIDKPDLQIPHPRLHLRRFALVPLNDCIPDFTHPSLKKSIKELLEICPDNSKVLPWTDEDTL